MTGRALYFEDVEVGEAARTPAMTITAAHCALFRGLAGDPGDDHQAVPELLPLALSTGLGWRIERPPLVVLAFVGFEWEIVGPLAVGDTIHSRARTISKRAMRGSGLVVEEHELVDQRDRVSQRGRFTFMVARRPVPSVGGLPPALDVGGPRPVPSVGGLPPALDVGGPRPVPSVGGLPPALDEGERRPGPDVGAPSADPGEEGAR